MFYVCVTHTRDVSKRIVELVFETEAYPRPVLHCVISEFWFHAKSVWYIPFSEALAQTLDRAAEKRLTEKLQFLRNDNLLQETFCSYL